MNRGDWREPIFKDDQDRQRFLETSESQDGGAIEKRDGHDFGLDCATFADGLSAYRGVLSERVAIFYDRQG
jgi:hypothetical protein